MSFFIGYVNGGIAAIILVVLSAILQGRLRKRPQALVSARVLSAIGAVLSAYYIYVAVTKLAEALAGTSGVAVIITSHIPQVILSALLLVHFVVLLVKVSIKGKAIKGLNTALLIVVVVQLIFYVFNLATHWPNLSHGLLAFLYVQILLTAIAAVSVVLFALVNARNRRAAL
jgi:hypothetical protein